jgi:hypothetical protein
MCLPNFIPRLAAWEELFQRDARREPAACNRLARRFSPPLMLTFSFSPYDEMA